MICPDNKHDVRAINPRASTAGDIVGAPPETKEEPAWCRVCGALWCQRPFGLGWGWAHSMQDRNAPTVGNFLRGEAPPQAVHELPKPEPFDTYNIQVISIWMTGPDADNFCANTLVDVSFFAPMPGSAGTLLALAARALAGGLADDFDQDEGLVLAEIQRNFNIRIGQTPEEQQ